MKYSLQDALVLLVFLSTVTILLYFYHKYGQGRLNEYCFKFQTSKAPDGARPGLLRKCSPRSEPVVHTGAHFLGMETDACRQRACSHGAIGAAKIDVEIFEFRGPVA